MEKNNEEVLLTYELYQTLINDILNQTINLKQQQGESLNRISVKKEVLKKLKSELKELGKNIRENKKQLRSEKRGLRKINSALEKRNYMTNELNLDFTSEEETYVDLQGYYAKLGMKKR